MEERFEPAVDGELDGEEKIAYDEHLKVCSACLTEHSRAEKLALELPMILTEGSEIEARALNATRQVINQIETERKEVALANKKVKKKRTLFLAAAWAGASVIMWRAIAMASIGGTMTVETIASSDLLAKAATSLSMTPMYFLIFMAGMIALTGGAVFGLSRVWSGD